MRNLHPNKKNYYLTGLLFFSLIGFAQTRKTEVVQNPKFEDLLQSKRKINQSLGITEGYKIQIFHGSLVESKKEAANFKRQFSDYDIDLVYSDPSYKVLVGPFENRLKAEGALLKIREKHPSALLIKP